MISSYWDRAKKFYRRNDSLFWCAGLFVFMHIVWWEVQQNRAFVSREERVRHLGPFNIPYLDELEILRRKRTTIQNDNQQQPPESNK